MSIQSNGANLNSPYARVLKLPFPLPCAGMRAVIVCRFARP
jgi:hypothetical protein